MWREHARAKQSGTCEERLTHQLRRVSPCGRSGRVSVVMDDGDADAEVYEKYADELIRFATTLVGPSDAPDVLSVAVIGALASSQWPRVSNRRAYLYRSVLNAARSLRSCRATTTSSGDTLRRVERLGAGAGSPRGAGRHRSPECPSSAPSSTSPTGTTSTRPPPLSCWESLRAPCAATSPGRGPT